MEIFTKEYYRVNSQDFNSLREVQQYVEANLGALIDSDLSLKCKKIDLFNFLVKNKKELKKWLSVEINLGDLLQSDYKNILDIDL